MPLHTVAVEVSGLPVFAEPKKKSITSDRRQLCRPYASVIIVKRTDNDNTTEKTVYVYLSQTITTRRRRVGSHELLGSDAQRVKTHSMLATPNRKMLGAILQLERKTCSAVESVMRPEYQ